ncbi:MAG: hypothetical protein WBA31_06325 [Candidatus Dormiibacterota bacterium]
MPDPLKPPDPPSAPNYRRRAGIPMAALALVVLLAAPVLVIHSALSPSDSLFSSNAPSLTALSTTPTPTPTPTCQSGWYWQVDISGGGSCCQKDSSDSTLAENAVLGVSESQGALADPSSSPTPTPTATPSDSPSPDPSDSPTPDPSDTPTPDPTDTPTPDPTDTPTPDPTDTSDPGGD